ncbi:MAG: TolB family protein, partial [Chitinophagaceae bacterium]
MSKSLWFIFLLLTIAATLSAQVNSVEFGRNRVQFKQNKWQYYQSRNFNAYFNKGGDALGKFAIQVAEDELPKLEEFIEYGLQRRANIVIYNSHSDMKQTNIGLEVSWQNTGGVTKLVNNKMVIFNNGDLNNLRIQIRQGIAKILVENLLFGDDLGEFAGNQALLDLPKWLTDGYVAYAAENWSAELDDQLKLELLSGEHKNFQLFAYRNPELAGHAFWNFIAEKYKKDNVTYLLYLARIYKNLNTASERITKKRFNTILNDFMQEETEKYEADFKGRRNQARGNVIAIEETKEQLDFYRFQANPQPRNNTYAMVQYKKGLYRVLLDDPSDKRKILLKAGVMNYKEDINPIYPLLAWDNKGTRLLVIYSEEGKIKMFIWDAVARIKRNKQTIDDLQLIQDAKYMLDNNTLVLSGVKNGQSDIFIYKIDQNKVQQVTNDVYSDLDPSFVSFPNKSGILFSSNRPSANAINNDTVIASRYRYNVFLADNNGKSDFNKLSQLTKLKYSDARSPLQYNVNHFTFVSAENGIKNRYAGFFSTKNAGLDTIMVIGDDVLRNPNQKELDSTLKRWQKSEPDSVGFIAITDDSSYVFPLTNYQTGLIETRGAGDNNLVSEVRKEGNSKYLYKLRIDENLLKKRNVNARPTDFMKRYQLMANQKEGDAIFYNKELKIQNDNEDSLKQEDVFQTEFTQDSGYQALPLSTPIEPSTFISRNYKLFDYKLRFSSDYIVSGFNNQVFVNKYQPYAGGSGPIRLSNGNSFNGIMRLGTSDLFEDIKFIGGFRISPNLRDFDYLVQFQNYRRRLDWGLVYFNSVFDNFTIPKNDTLRYAKLYSSLYQVTLAWPFDEVRSVRAHIGFKNDIASFRPDIYDNPYFYENLVRKDTLITYGLMQIEYVHDNSVPRAQNIWNGLRYKVYLEMNGRLTSKSEKGRMMFNIGGDARKYYSIYRNFIWAGRAAFDMSLGSQKVVYYLGGTDGWLSPKFNDGNRPANDADYTYQTLALNLRGHKQNVANGNNAITLNS